MQAFSPQSYCGASLSAFCALTFQSHWQTNKVWKNNKIVYSCPFLGIRNESKICWRQRTTCSSGQTVSTSRWLRSTITQVGKLILYMILMLLIFFESLTQTNRLFCFHAIHEISKWTTEKKLLSKAFALSLINHVAEFLFSLQVARTSSLRKPTLAKLLTFRL